MARIAIDVRVTQGGYPGIGRATLCRVEALLRRGDHQFLLVYRADRPLPARLRAAIAPPHRLLATRTPLRSPADQVTTPLLLRRARVDLFHSPYYAQALLTGCPYVLEVYDLIPERYPGYWPAAQLRVIRAWLRRATRGAAHLITSSRASADDLIRLYGIWPERITVAPLAADAGWLLAQDQGAASSAPDTHIRPQSPCTYGAYHFRRPRKSQDQTFLLPTAAGGPAASGEAKPTPYLLCVCTNKPHKNLTRLVEAFGILLREGRTEPDLVIAGGWDDRYPEPAQAAARLVASGGGPRVRFVRDPDDAALRALYRGALGFVFPSEYEGFGLPVLEAMLMGLPVAASSTPAVAEVAGDACLRFDPLDRGAMARCMARLADEPALREQLRAAGLARAAHFSWEEAAGLTLEAYEAVLSRDR